MKKVALITLTLALSLSFAFAGNLQPEKPVRKAKEANYELLLSQVSNEHLIFRLIKENKDVFKVRVFDAEGKTLYCHRIKKNNKSKTTFDISEFPAGEYKFQIVKNKEVLFTETVEKN